VPLTIQTVFIFAVAYRWMRAWKVRHAVAAPGSLIGASNFFELAVAAAIALFGLQSGAALGDRRRRAGGGAGDVGAGAIHQSDPTQVPAHRADCCAARVMSDVVVPPQITDSARALLDGRPVHVRSSRRHGCCGGAASVPVAEPGTPQTLDDVERFDVEGTEIYVDRGLPGADGSWTIDTDGFGRWRRLVVIGLPVSVRRG
jgi:hypothetical protein